ncbi:MAG: hypothetical protein IJS99_09210 [Synergistaceae bacterium]|nr:hypothetical protein [Synergistaceae bacterium]
MKQLLEFLIDREKIKFTSYIDELLYLDSTDWTVPKWCRIGDIVFFMHAKTADVKIKSAAREYENRRSEFPAKHQNMIETAFKHAFELYNRFGGKIFAFGRVFDSCEISPTEGMHWKSDIYAPINEIYILDNPVSIEEFREFLFIARQSTITPVFGDSFDKLKDLMLSKNNKLPEYLLNSRSVDILLQGINSSNWLEIARKALYKFSLESKFREFFVDYLLKELGDIKTIYKECPCYKNKRSASYVDNIILFDGLYLPVEIKLNINLEEHIIPQLTKYCHLSKLILDGNKKFVDLNKIYSDNVLIIDRDGIYLYTDSAKNIIKIFLLDYLRDFQDIKNLRQIIIGQLNNSK